MNKKLRIDRILANYGYASRAEAKVLVARHRVRIGSTIVRKPEELADPSEVSLDNEPIERPLGVLVMLNKPLGVVCSHDEREGDRIFDLVPERWLRRNPQVVSAGRLDKDSTGLVVITDDYALVHRLTSPKHHVNKVYEVQVDGDITDSVVEKFASGTLLIADDPVVCKPAKLELTTPRCARVTLTEGRNRQLRRMFAACGLTVETLHRVAFGNLEIGTLAEGAWCDVEGSIETVTTVTSVITSP